MEEFYDNLLTKYGFELLTVNNYRRVLTKFVRETGENPEKEQVEKYLAEMRKKDYSYTHLSNTGIAIQRYMDFIKKPIEFVRPRKPNTLPAKEILTEGEVARILATVNNNREAAMVGILAYCGLRNAEVCKLKVSAIDLDNNLIKVLGGKFKKDRIVPLSKECAKIIINYLNDFPREINEYLFTTLKENKQYNGAALRKRVKVVAQRAKIKKRVYPHIFRHSLITNLIIRGMNLVAVQHLAGHMRIETTMLYTHLNQKKIQQEYQYFVPSFA